MLFDSGIQMLFMLRSMNNRRSKLLYQEHIHDPTSQPDQRPVDGC